MATRPTSPAAPSAGSRTATSTWVWTPSWTSRAPWASSTR